MENSTRAQERKNPFLQTSQNINSSNNGVQIQTLLSESKPIYRSEQATTAASAVNTYPTTFIEADTSSFKQVVQMLTGSLETAKQASKSTNNTTTIDPLPKTNLIPPIKTVPPIKKQGFKLYERRNNNSFKNIKLSPLIPGSIQNCGFSPRNHQHHYPEILSPSMLDFPSLKLSPVTPLISDPFNRSSPASVTSNASSIEEEDKAIAEKGFYLHPSPISTPRDSEPQLLPLFPLTSPRVAGWTPQVHKPSPLASNNTFWISFHGVPANFWTPEIIKKLSAHCGDFLYIDMDTLSLEDITSIKVKVRNTKGPNNIPRILNLQTPEGDFEIQVNIVPRGAPLSSPVRRRVTIPEVEGADVDDRLAVLDDVDQSEETVSDNWTRPGVRGFFRYMDTLSTARLRTLEAEKVSHGRRNVKKRTMKKTLVRKKTRSDRVLPNGVWRWVPKIRDSLGAIPTPPTISNSNSNPISVSTTSSNSNLPQISNSNTISQIFLSHPSCTVFSQPQPMLVSQPLVENTTELAQRRLQIGLDVGMTVEGNDSRALALIGEYIRRDLAAATALKMKHQNPDLLFSNGVLLEQEDPTSDEEDCVQSIRTPMATFIDPLDCWNESFLQVEYSNESLSIPPGFDASNTCSIRSLKASIKNHQNNKKSLLGSSRAEVSQCARRQ